MSLQPEPPLAPRVTVIVATFNSCRSLEWTLRSVLDQTFHDFEVWVVGDACTDASAQVVRDLDDPRLNWVNLDHNSGSQSAPNTEGLWRARGAWIAYLGHDDLWLPCHLQSLMDAVDGAKDRDVGFVHAVVAVAARDGAWGLFGVPTAKPDAMRNFVPPSGWCHRRDIVDSAGGWGDPNAGAYPVDFDLQRRAAKHGVVFVESGVLSVLKFPSIDWGAFSLDHGYPQPEYYHRIRQNPAGLRAEILGSIAYGLWPYRPRTLRQRFATMLDGIGRDRWPLGPILERSLQAARRRNRARRGMPLDAK